MRLFVAVDPPEEVKDAAERVAARLQIPDVRWTRPEGRHFTLRFLGEVPNPEVVSDALRSVHAAPFEVSLDAVGAFPSWRRTRVLWVGATGEWTALAEAVESALAPAFGPSDKVFHTHLTLARLRESRRIEPPDVVVPAVRWTVEEFVLFRSRLHPKGARYEPLDRFSLA